LPPPLAKAMAIMAAASMTHDNGFHMKPKNLRNLLSLFSSSLFGPKILSLSSPCAVLNPSFVHLSCWNTSSTGILSYTNINTAFMINILVFRDFRNINMSNRNEKQQQHTKHVSCMCMCVCRREMLTRSIFSFFICSKETSPMMKDETEQEDQNKKISTSTSISWGQRVSFNRPENIPFIGLSRRRKWQRRREIRCVCYP